MNSWEDLLATEAGQERSSRAQQRWTAGGLAVAAVAALMVASRGREVAKAPREEVGAPEAGFAMLESSWAAQISDASPPPAASERESEAPAGHDEDAQRAARARELWTNLDIAVRTDR